MIQDWI